VSELVNEESFVSLNLLLDVFNLVADASSLVDDFGRLLVSLLLL
jgi:hypothetical protein